ncbi:PAS domain S-box-containing protein [Motilibacter peucedani]|uniref:PAS domain S-box-containing protein n=1 Tax=Motilibacter peucedani TaxID=598650 RepID=A0A420XU08_9ACTN|nr:GAF domain-containing protein [Motilibacter peucedani]RKS80315.1 PAS domain S-box-containing protein [Motilibacter peucedani]
MLRTREEREFAATPESVPEARRVLRGALSAWNLDELVDGAAVVVTELLTNAVLHACEPIRLVLEPHGERGLRIEVHDGSPHMPLRPRADTDATTGRGMGLVALLAEHWGAEPEGEGKLVWCEIGPEAQEAEALWPSAPAGDEFDLESWGDLLAETGPTRHTVHLGDVPTDLLLAAKYHVDSLVRELTLTATGAESGITGALPAHLSELIRTVSVEFAEARQSIKRQALAADERGEARTSLTLTLPPGAADAGRRYLAALEEADRYARGERLLTLASPPQHTLFRRWYVSELVRALERAQAGEPDQPPTSFESFLLHAVDELAELQLASALAARLHRATEALAGAQDLAAVAEVAVEHAVSELAAAGGAVLLADGRWLRALATVGSVTVEGEAQVSAPLPGAQAHRTGEAVWVESREERDEQFPALVVRGDGVVATCAVPLVVAGHSIGALELVFSEGRLFSPDERAFCTALGGVAAQTLERVRLDESRRQIVQRLTRLQAVTSALAQVRDTEGVLDVVISHAVGLVGARIASLSLLDPDGATLRTRRLQPTPGEELHRWASYSLHDDLPASEALRTGDPIWVGSVAERNSRWPALRGVSDDFEHTTAVLPLAVDDSVLGVLTLSFSEGDHGGGEPAWEFFTAFADACAQALERARVAESVQDANRKLAFLADATGQLGESFDIDRTLVNLARLAVPELADWCVVHLFEEGELRVVAVEHVDADRRELAREVQERWPASVNDGTGIGRVVRTGVPVFVPDIPAVTAHHLPDRDPQHTAVLQELGFESLLLVPLSARGRTLGALSLMTSGSHRHYGEADFAFAQDLARRVAVAIDNARLFAALGAGLGSAQEGGESAERLAAILETVVDAFFRIDTEWRFVYVNRPAERLLMRRREELLGRSMWDLYPAALGTDFELGYRSAMQTGQQVTFEAYYQPFDAWVEVRATPDPEGLSVFLHRVDERRAMEAERERANERLRTVAAASSRFAALLEPAEVLDALTALLVPAMGSYALVALRSTVGAAMLQGAPRGDDDVRLVHLRHADRSREAELAALLGGVALRTSDESGPGAVTRSGVATELPAGVRWGDSPLDPALAELTATDAYAVPLVSRGRTLGAVVVAAPEEGTTDRTLVDELAARAAVALDNALLYRAERRNGIELQRHLLPRSSPQVPGAQIATRYLPSSQGALTGGDFYEALETPDGLVLALGDVVGHGMRSAARMGQLRAIVAALALQRLDPGELLGRIAADVDKLLDLGLATLLVCRFDTATRSLAVASAGHPPPLVTAVGGPAAYVELDAGPPLGVGAEDLPEHGAYPMVTVEVPVGGTVVLFSDGLVENRGESLTLGLERLRLALQEVSLPPELVADHLLRATGREQGGDDDVALLVLRSDARTWPAAREEP